MKNFTLGIIAAALLAGCAGLSSAVTPGGANAAVRPAARQKTFKYTGHEEKFVVPNGVTTIAVDAVGGSGAGAYYSTGCNNPCFGRGGRVSAHIPVKAGETLYVRVGGSGRGGGYYGGGGGGGGVGGYGNNQAGNGGGGGSSYIEPKATRITSSRGWKYATGNGSVVFSW